MKLALINGLIALVCVGMMAGMGIAGGIVGPVLADLLGHREVSAEMSLLAFMVTVIPAGVFVGTILIKRSEQS